MNSAQPPFTHRRFVRRGGAAYKLDGCTCTMDVPMSEQFDLIVIGSGAAASSVAYPCREAGWRVAVIDHRPLGGTCSLRGCDPKKVLVGASEALEYARRLTGQGLAGEVRIDWPALMRRKRRFTDPVPEERARAFAAVGIATTTGRASFVVPDALRVGGDTLRFRHAVIAAGAEPVPLGIDGEQHLVSSERFLNLEALPARLVFVGGGYIAAEFSRFPARTGGQVTVLQRRPHMLPAFDPDLVEMLMERFRALGIDVRTGATAEAIEPHGRSVAVRARTPKGMLTIEADRAVHAAGRAPDFASLNPADIATEKGRLRLNEFLQGVSNPAVYAAGDAASAGPPLTPVAGRDGAIIAANLLSGNHRRPDYHGVPSVAVTVPPIASVGLSEAAARSRFSNLSVRHERGSDWYTARQAAEPVYGYKTLVDRDTDAILGAHLVGPHAEEVINLFALAIRTNLRAEQMSDTVFAYPTSSPRTSATCSAELVLRRPRRRRQPSSRQRSSPAAG
jgi:glutathione reductase (NADPH)